jgi:hypothetical protein
MMVTKMAHPAATGLSWNAERLLAKVFMISSERRNFPRAAFDRHVRDFVMTRLNINARRDSVLKLDALSTGVGFKRTQSQASQYHY